MPRNFILLFQFAGLVFYSETRGGLSSGKLGEICNSETGAQ